MAGDSVAVSGNDVDTVAVEDRVEPLADSCLFDRWDALRPVGGVEARYISTRLSVSASSAGMTSMERSSRSVIVRGGCGNSSAGSSGSASHRMRVTGVVRSAGRTRAMLPMFIFPIGLVSPPPRTISSKFALSDVHQLTSR